MKILVVEDQLAELKLMHHVLSAAGNEVREAAAAEIAFASIKEELPDIILTDIALPGMDGLELVRRLKADPATRDIPVVVVTSYPDRYTRDMVMAAGCDAFFAKPLSTRALPATMREVLTQRRGGRLQ